MTLVVLEELVRSGLVAVAVVVGLTAAVQDVRCDTGSVVHSFVHEEDDDDDGESHKKRRMVFCFVFFFLLPLSI